SLTVCLNAQVMGNYEISQRGSSGNVNVHSQVNFNAQYRGVPKAAQFVNDHTLEFTINALSNQRADAYVAIFSVLQVGKTAAEANERINERLDKVRAAALAIGIKSEDFYIDMVNFLPKYEYEVSKKIFSKKTYTEIPSGFEVQKNIHVRYRDPMLLDAIISAAAEEEIYDIVKVDYFVDEPQKIYAELRQKTFEYLAQIEELYINNGLALDTAYRLTAENAWVAYPTNRYEGYQAFSSQRLPGNAASANVNRADKPYARFYNAIPANDYDIVINSDILEPAAQFSYNLKVRFTLQEREIPTNTVTVTKEKYLILTPDGKLVRMDVQGDE
ncbi:MAG: SIMPL domain-containing protein, partial [Bacteroidota bacterium]